MKKITFFIAMAFAAINLQAIDQLKIADFESGSTYFTKSSAGLVAMAIVDNPDDSNINTSAKVLKITYSSGYNGYSVVVKESGVGTVIPLVVGNVEEIVAGKYRYIHFMLYKPFKSKILLTLQKPGIVDGQSPQYLNQKVNEWEAVSIDMLDATKNLNLTQNTTYDGIMLNLDKAGRSPASTEGFVAYIDNLYLSNDATTATPSIRQNATSDIKVMRTLEGDYQVKVSNVDYKNLKLEVFNMQGQLLKLVFNGKPVVDSYEIPALSKGNYILKATTEKNVQCVKF